MKYLPIAILLFFVTNYISGQHTDANVFGDVQSEGEHVPFANIYLEGTTIGTTTGQTGHYMFIDLPIGTHVFVVKALGYSTDKKTVEVVEGKNRTKFRAEAGGDELRRNPCYR